MGDAGADVMRTTGGGNVYFGVNGPFDGWPVTTGDRVYARDHETGDVIQCASPPTVLEVDAGDYLNGPCY
jgi:hypothetical protein